LTDDEIEYLTDAEEEQKYNKNESNEAKNTNATDNIPIINVEDEETVEYKAFPRPFVVGKVLNEQETQVSNTENLRIVMSELECEWAWNKPIGKKQTTKKFLDYFVHRKGDIKEWNKPMKNNSTFQKSNVNENFVEISTSMFNKPQEEKEDFKPKHLKSIWEGNESDSDQNTAEKNQKREQDDKVMTII